MAWDKHNGGYYRSRRKGTQVIRDYYGKGDAENLAAAVDEYRRHRLQVEKDLIETLRRRWAEASKPLDHLRECIDVVLRAVFLLGSDRFLRSGIACGSTLDVMTGELRVLVVLGESGGIGVLPEVTQWFCDHPHFFGQLTAAAKEAYEFWLSRHVSNAGRLADAERENMSSWKLSTAGPMPSPLEVLLVEQIAAIHLQSNCADAMQSQELALKASKAVQRELGRINDECWKRLAARRKQLERLRKRRVAETVN